MTDSEHRRALPFLPLAAVGVAGSDGDGTNHTEMTHVISELVYSASALFQSGVLAAV